MLSKANEAASLRRGSRCVSPRVSAAITLATGLLVTALGTWKAETTLHEEAQARFKLHAERLTEGISQQLHQPLDGLNGLRALSRVVPEFNRADFRKYVASLDLEQDYPGVRGFGLIERVSREELDSFTARERADDAPDLEVRPSAGVGDLLVVKYVEPANRNERVQGVDMTFDPARREVAERASATGQASLSAPLRLLHRGSNEPGWLLMTPIYWGGKAGSSPPPPVRGILFAAIAVQELLAHVQQEFDGDLQFVVRDSGTPGKHPLYDSRPAPAESGRGNPTRVPLFGETRDVHFAGRTFNVDITSTPQLEASNGRIEAGLVGLAGTTTSILLALIVVRLSQSRQQAESTSQERERLIRLMIENIPARLSYWDRELRCRMVNRALTAVFTAPRDEVLGKQLQELLPADRWRLLEPRVLAALNGVQQEFECSTVTESGCPATALFYCVPDVQHGEVAGVLLASIDITGLKNAQKEAERASRAKSQFLSNMSHEIRTPMNAVLGMLSLLRMTPLNERQGDYAHKAEAAARSLLGLLNDILDVSRIESGKMTLDPQPFSLRALLDDLQLILTAAIGEKPIAFRIDVDPRLPSWLIADDMRLRQILINLGGNAIKFTHSGEVSLAFKHGGQASDRILLEVAVTDTGIGISADDQRRIFAEFSQASASTTRSFGGSGLGLTICSRLLSLMASELHVDSTPGRGSRFHFKVWMPIAEEQTQPAPLSSPVPTTKMLTGARPLQGLRLLVVEDNVINQQVAREVLISAGASVQIAENGKLAVETLARDKHFDAVLMDIQMPVMDGLEAARQIRKTLGKTDLPIIAMSANAMESDREQSRAAGMVDHVGKPFIPEELIEILLRHIQGRSRESSRAQTPHLARNPHVADASLVNRAAAIALMRDEALYGQLVPGFLKDLKDTIPHLLELPTLPREEATRMLHTLKCTAATMGANRLSEVAASLELRSRSRSELDPNLIEQVAEQIKATISAFELE
jgi:PAS domain S-box-containing protein